MTNDEALIKALLDALLLAEGVASIVIQRTEFDESQVSDWRPQLRDAATQAAHRLRGVTDAT